MQAEIRVLYDGWPLVHLPDSSQTIHLWQILNHIPVGVKALLALPGPAPSWLPPTLVTQQWATPNTPAGQLRWEQHRLPLLARQQQADLIHLTHLHSPLLTATPVVISPAEYAGAPPERVGLVSRLRAALATGAMARPRTMLWPQDLPAPEKFGAVTRLPLPSLDLTLSETEKALALPETFVLYHGPGDKNTLIQLLDVWSWASAPLGEDYPLLILGLDAARRAWLENWLAEHDLQAFLQFPPVQTPLDIQSIYQRCNLLLHPADLAPWGDAVYLGLALAKPIVAAETTWADARVGPAGYLVDRQDARGLGAACLTLIVQENIAAELAGAAEQRAREWQKKSFSTALEQVYRGLLE